MKKQFLLMTILCLAALPAWAERIDVATARKVAEGVAKSEGAVGGLRSGGELPLVYAAIPVQGGGSALRSSTAVDEADYFVFDFPGGKGFAIVSGDDRVRPVIGYSDKGNFDPDNLPENLRGMLTSYQKQITWAIDKGITPSSDVVAEWSRYMSGTELRAAKQKLLKTADWNQFEPYNLQTPVIDGEHAVTGCTATAMAIVMHYHKYPERAVNPPAINVYKVDGKETSSHITYGNYDWENMLYTYNGGEYNEAQAEAVSTLMWHCGANLNMNYGLDGSGAGWDRVLIALRDVFGYSPSMRFIERLGGYRWAEFKAMLRSELDADYPVPYCASEPGGGAHAFVCDGYNSDDLYHINWGWGGSSNGFYVLSLLDNDGDGLGYGDGQTIITNIRPTPTGERYYVRPHLFGASYSKSGLYANATGGYNYSTNIMKNQFYIELGVADQDNHIVVTPSSPQLIDLTDEEGGWMELKERSITLSSDLTDGQRITLLFSLDGSNWEVMRASYPVPLGIDNNGEILPTPDDPNDPEQSLVVTGISNNRYVTVSGLDNNGYADVKQISYYLTYVKENIIIRYTLKDYANWKDHLAIYTGKDHESLDGPNKGEKVTIGEDCSFEVTVTPEQIENGTYNNYLKVLSDKEGVLTYDIQVFSASDLENPAFEKLDNKMIFVNPLTAVWNVNLVSGVVNQEIPVTLHFENVSELLAGKQLKLLIRIDNAKEGQVQLFDAQGEEIQLETVYDALYSKKNVAVGTLEENTPYTFKIKSNTVFQSSDALSLIIYSYVDDNDFGWSPYVTITVADDPTANEEIAADETQVWASGDRLFISVPKAETAYIVTFDGRLHRTLSLPAGESTVPMPRGLYIIRIGDRSYKVKL